MVISRKQALRRIEGLIQAHHPDASIHGHIETLSRLGSGSYIRAELHARSEEIERLAQHVGGHTEEGILMQTTDWNLLLAEVPDVLY